MTPDAIPMAFVDGVQLASLEAFHDHILGTASGIVAVGKDVAAPVMFVLSQGGKLAIIPGAFLSKQGVANFQQAVVRDPMVRACALVFEAWVSAYETKPDNPVMPADDPNRTEAIVVSILTAGRQAMTFSPIKRPANTVERAQFKWLDEVDGKFDGRFVRRNS
jgi:hypothetical protein